MSMLKDDSLMPFGKYKGTKMANVPASYLLWVKKNQKGRPSRSMTSVLAYINDNIDILKKEVSNE